MRGDEGAVRHIQSVWPLIWPCGPPSPRWGEVPSACEAMRGRFGRFRACGPLIRPCGPPSPRWGEEGGRRGLPCSWRCLSYRVARRSVRAVRLPVIDCGMRAPPRSPPSPPAGRSAERRRGDEGVFPRIRSEPPPHPALRATFSPPGRREERLPLSSRQNAFRRLLRDHDHRRIGVARDDRRHD